MSAFIVAAARPAATGSEILRTIERLLRPTKIRFSPAVASHIAIAVQDGDERIIVCAWNDRELIRAALALRSDDRFVIDEGVA